MDSLRVVPKGTVSPLTPCCRCDAAGSQWDHIMGRAYCPDCEESLALGEGPPLILRTEKRGCVICSHLGTVRFLTFPLHAPSPVELDLCPEHFRALLGRRLGPQAFQQLSGGFRAMGLAVDQIFLLHEVFYDSTGRALQPIAEPD